MDATRRAMMNVTSLNLWGVVERVSRSAAVGFKKGLVLYGKWRLNRRSRLALLRMNDRMLKDIGITYVDALQEGKKPFWKE